MFWSAATASGLSRFVRQRAVVLAAARELAAHRDEAGVPVDQEERDVVGADHGAAGHAAGVQLPCAAARYSAQVVGTATAGRLEQVLAVEQHARAAVDARDEVQLVAAELAGRDVEVAGVLELARPGSPRSRSRRASCVGSVDVRLELGSNRSAPTVPATEKPSTCMMSNADSGAWRFWLFDSRRAPRAMRREIDGDARRGLDLRLLVASPSSSRSPSTSAMLDRRAGVGHRVEGGRRRRRGRTGRGGRCRRGRRAGGGGRWARRGAAAGRQDRADGTAGHAQDGGSLHEFTAADPAVHDIADRRRDPILPARGSLLVHGGPPLPLNRQPGASPSGGTIPGTITGVNNPLFRASRRDAQQVSSMISDDLTVLIVARRSAVERGRLARPPEPTGPTIVDSARRVSPATTGRTRRISIASR